MRGIGASKSGLLKFLGLSTRRRKLWQHSYIFTWLASHFQDEALCVVSGSGSCFGSGSRSGPGFGFAPGLITLRIQQ